MSKKSVVAESSKTQERSARLVHRIMQEIEAGQRRFLFWGLDRTSKTVLQSLKARRLLDYVIAIIDDKHSEQKFLGRPVYKPTCVTTLDFDTLIITEDQAKETALLEFSNLDKRIPRVIIDGMEHQRYSDPAFQRILSSCEVKPKAGGYDKMLVHIYQSLGYLVRSNKKGSVAEFGVFRGGTTAFIARTLEYLGYSTPIYGFDTFEVFLDKRNVLDLFEEDEYRLTSYEKVCQYLSPFNVRLIKGDISETHRLIEKIPLIFSFFDTDRYTPTRNALEQCLNQTVRGGIIAFDHFYSDERWLYTLGERIAASQILSERNAFNLYGTGIFIKM